MSTSAEIREYWLSTIFQNGDILDFTENIYSYNLFQNQEVACDLEKAMYNGVINFIELIVQRYKTPGEIGNCDTYQHRVQVRYYREQIDGEETFNIIQDFFEVLDDLVKTELGAFWGDLINGFTRDQEYPQIGIAGVLDERIVVSGNYTYFAESN